MQKLKKMTRQQSKTLAEYGIENAHNKYYVERFTPKKAVLVSKSNSLVREVLFNGQE